MTPSRGYGTHDEDYEGLWEKRYREQHRTVHSLEDEIARLRASEQQIKDHLSDIITNFWIDSDLESSTSVVSSDLNGLLNELQVLRNSLDQ